MVKDKADAKHSRLLDVHVWSDYPEVKAITEELSIELLASEERKRARSKVDADKFVKTLRVILIDLFVEWEKNSNSFIAYSRNKNNYVKDTRYSSLFIRFQPMVDVVDGLISLGYVDNVEGFYDRRTGIGKQSRMKATEKLTKLFEQHELNIFMVSVSDDFELIQLKDNDKKLMDYEDIKETEEMRENLLAINRQIAKHSVNLEILDSDYPLRSKKGHEVHVNMASKSLHRVFNGGSFKLGGRFYGGWWQAVPSHLRKFITILDCPTVEIDYSGMHVDMMYALKHKQMPNDDAYALDGYPKSPELRSLIKKTFNAMINAKDKRIQKPKGTDQILPKGKSYTDLKNDIYEAHKDIQEYFYSGKGRELQYRDSKIAERVMVNMLKYWDSLNKKILPITVLPVHDSFIVAVTFEGILMEEMRKSFFAYTGRWPKVKFEKRDNCVLMDLIEDCKGKPAGYYKRAPDYQEKAYSIFRNREHMFQRFKDKVKGMVG